MTELLLGIDCGSSVTKAGLYTLEGREVAISSSSTETLTRNEGEVERSSAGIWASVAEAVRGVVADAGVDPRSVIGIGCSGHGNGLYALDARGDPLATAYQSLDTRADSIVGEWRHAGVDEPLYRDAWQQLWAGQPLALLEWLLRHEPETYESISTILLCKDFVNYKLTGRVATEYSDASAAGLLVNAELAYNADLLARVGHQRLIDKLPALAGSCDVIGALTDESATELGLVAGTRVVGGLFDVVASAIGSGGATEGSLSLVAGTWSINAVVTHQPMVGRALLMTSAFADAKRWIAIEASATSAANLSWFASEAFADGGDHGDEGTVFDRCCEVAALSELRLSSPIYHPFLYGSPTNAAAKAGFYGLSGNHDRADLAHAVLEGVAFGHRRHVQNLVAIGANPTRVRLTGGGARSPFWCQIFAHVLDLPIEVPDAEEAGARGAALAAGVGVGAFADIDEAMDHATGVARCYEPDPTFVRLHGQRYEIYLGLVEAMASTWRALAEDAVGDPA